MVAIALLFLHVAVAVEAPAHAEGLLHPHLLHLVDATVALDAADARRDVDAVVEVHVVGELVDATHSIGLPLAQLSRIGSSIVESVFTTWWQFMQVSVGGTIASGARSTFTWQYRQSSPSWPAWSRCE